MIVDILFRVDNCTTPNECNVLYFTPIQAGLPLKSSEPYETVPIPTEVERIVGNDNSKHEANRFEKCAVAQ